MGIDAECCAGLRVHDDGLGSFDIYTAGQQRCRHRAAVGMRGVGAKIDLLPDMLPHGVGFRLHVNWLSGFWICDNICSMMPVFQQQFAQRLNDGDGTDAGLALGRLDCSRAFLRGAFNVHRAFYMAIIGYTGLRKGKVLALRWTDIRFDESILLVYLSGNRQTSKQLM